MALLRTVAIRLPNCYFEAKVVARGYTLAHPFAGHVLTSLPFQIACRPASTLTYLLKPPVVEQSWNPRKPDHSFRTGISGKLQSLNFMNCLPLEAGISRRPMSTKTKETSEVTPSSSSNPEGSSLSKKAKLKQAVKDYGATVIIFHVTMSLGSLGFFYALVSSGLDPVMILKAIGVSESILESKITQGASTFVVAYAVHKVFAPLRITITLTATPFIVRYLRGIGILKKPVS